MLERQKEFPIARAQMRLLIESPVGAEAVKMALLHLLADEPEIEVSDGRLKMTVLIDPGNFRQVHEAVARASSNRGTVLTVSLKDFKNE